MGFANWDALHQALEQQMAQVRLIFNELIGEDAPDGAEESENQEMSELWHDKLEQSELDSLLTHLDDGERKSVFRTLTEFRQDVDKRTIGPRGRLALDQLMPRLLNEACARVDADSTLRRLIPLLLGVVTRTTYLELLTESPAR